jgi:hypothetical protein
MPHHVVKYILPIEWHHIHIDAKRELLHSVHDIPKGAADLRHRIYLPIEGFAMNVETEFPVTPFKLLRDYEGAILCEIDSGDDTFTFSSKDELSQVHKGEREIKE